MSAILKTFYVSDTMNDQLNAQSVLYDKLFRKGGAVLDAGTRSLLVEQPTVWLQVGPAQGAHRVGLDVPRPVLLGNVRGRLVTLLNERGPLYTEVARLTVDTEGRTPDEVADAVLAGLGEAS
jgi:shikimate kinase